MTKIVEVPEHGKEVLKVLYNGKFQPLTGPEGRELRTMVSFTNRMSEKAERWDRVKGAATRA